VVGAEDVSGFMRTNSSEREENHITKELNKKAKQRTSDIYNPYNSISAVCAH